MTWTPDPDRAYRVAFLRADEAKRLSELGDNQRHDCCPHLWHLHERGERTDGSMWSFCLLCDCEEETPVPHWRAQSAKNEARYRAETLLWLKIRLVFWSVCPGGLLGAGVVELFR